MSGTILLEILSGIFLISGLLVCFWDNLGLGSLMVAVSIIIIILLEKDTKNKKLNIRLPKLNDDKGQLILESFQKALDDYNFIQKSKKQIKDKELLTQIEKMQDISKRFLYYLKKEPEKVILARKFIDYYQDRAVLLIKKYISLEETNLQTDEVKLVKQKMKDALNNIDEAYEEQFSKAMSEQLIDINAELEVMNQMFDDDGVLEKVKKEESSNEKKQVEDFLYLTQNGCKNFGRRKFFIKNDLSKEELKTVLIKKFLASFLAIFFGTLGAHKFYLGKNISGFFYLIFFWTFIPSVLGLIEGIRYLFMSADDFYGKYLK